MNEKVLFEKFGDRIFGKLESYSKDFTDFTFGSINFIEGEQLIYRVNIKSNNKKEINFDLVFLIKHKQVIFRLDEHKNGNDLWSNFVGLEKYNISLDISDEIPNSILSILIDVLGKFLPIIISDLHKDFSENGYIFQKKGVINFFKNFLR